MCLNQGGCDAKFYNNGSKMGLLTRVGCVQGWDDQSPNLDAPQVVSCVLLILLPTVQIHPLEHTEGHGGWSLESCLLKSSSCRIKKSTPEPPPTPSRFQ